MYYHGFQSVWKFIQDYTYQILAVSRPKKFEMCEKDVCF